MSCVVCGLSINNGIHKQRTRYNYHTFVERLPVEQEPKFPRFAQALQEVTDPETRFALQTLLEELEHAL